MKNISLIIGIIITNQVWCNILLFENTFSFAQKISLQDTAIENTDKSILDESQTKASFKSPGKALLYSGVLPGMGQVYMGNWMRAIFFVALEGLSLGTWLHNNNLASDKKRAYVYYANDHWNFGRWVDDYYKWYEYNENNPTSEYNSIREIFINYSDSTTGCAQDPTQGNCYIDIWEHSHKVDFFYDGTMKSSSDDDFKIIFQTLCGNPQISDKECSNTLEEVEGVLTEKSVYVSKDHHFYEGIQKYDMYFAGWDDNDSVSVITKVHGDKNASSPNQVDYRKLWGEYNTIKTLAGNGGKFMLINRVVSMVDALILAKKWNNKHNLKLSLNTYPDLRNKSGLGSIILSLKWK